MKPATKMNIAQAMGRYPHKRAALLPALWAVQQDEGWVPRESLGDIAAIMGITASEVREVASFYTMFARTPMGKHHVRVCIGICCRLRGSDTILAHLKEKLGISAGETTDDETVHLSTVECLGSCGTAPMMQVDDDYYENLTIEQIDEIVERLKT